MDNKKSYGAYVLEFFDDNEAVGIRQGLKINSDTPPEIASAIKVLAKAINDNFELVVAQIAEKATKQ